MDIPVPQKYRWEGKHPKSQSSDGTPNGGDAYLQKNRRKNKLGLKAKNREVSAAGMRYLHILPSGRGVWERVR